MHLSPVRILVVDDFEPWRRFACSLLREKPELQVVGEASDGLEAVQKARQLKPDLILLDIHLPRLNGLGVAGQIRKLALESKIIFLTQEYSAEVAQVASMSARGYVVKASAATELLAAVEAVLSGKSFVSGTKED